MNKHISCSGPFDLILFCSLAFFSSFAAADTSLNVKLTPTININGPLGSLQAVQYSTNLANTNAWTTLSYIRLDTLPKPFFDNSAAGQNRFYRTKMVGVADSSLVWIPPGTFLMGSPTNEPGHVSVPTISAGAEEPQTLVTLTRGFMMGRYEVRNIEWLLYMTNLVDLTDLGTNLTYYQRSVVLNGVASPVAMWQLASNYCALRTADELARGLIPPGWFYRLPTEAEWEYACRAGSTNAFGIGSGLELRNDAIRQDAAFDGRYPYPSSVSALGPVFYQGSSSRPSVGSFPPNGFGLYDMHGDNQELCWDSLGFILPGGAVTNLVGTLGGDGGFIVVARGGSITQSGSDCRAASRKFSSDILANKTGFRVVLIPPDP